MPSSHPLAASLATRRSPRLPGFDYTAARVYFVTFCTAYREAFLATICDGHLRLSPPGRLVARAWRDARARYPGVHLLAGVIMPDHVHVLLALEPQATGDGVGAGVNPPALPHLIGTVKAHAAAQINRLRGTPGARVWQRSFHDHIIRTPADLAACRTYIAQNPCRWTLHHTAL